MASTGTNEHLLILLVLLRILISARQLTEEQPRSWVEFEHVNMPILVIETQLMINVSMYSVLNRLKEGVSDLPLVNLVDLNPFLY
jgi:hypothetical protein